MLDELEDIAAQVTAISRAELPAYAAIPLDDHRAAVQDQLSVILTGLREMRGPGPADLITAERLGRRRAEQGIDISALMRAYELPLQELWQRYAGLVCDGKQAQELIALAPSLLRWLHQLGGAAATGHQIVTTSQLANEVRLQAQLLDLITADPAGAQTLVLAGRLGLDTGGTFQAVGFTPSVDPHRLERVIVRLRIHAGPVVAGVHDGMFVVLQQHDRTGVVTQLCRPHAAGGVFGIGEPRYGLQGAALSIGDARRAAGLAAVLGHDVVFSRQWLVAAVLASAHPLDHLGRGAEIASEHPHLSEAVTAFAHNGFSTAAAARVLHLHPNTVSYRLDRWTQLTGWELNDFEGLARSVVCIALSARRASGPSATASG